MDCYIIALGERYLYIYLIIPQKFLSVFGLLYYCIEIRVGPLTEFFYMGLDIDFSYNI